MEMLPYFAICISLVLALINGVAYFGNKREGFFGKMLENNARSWRGGAGGKVLSVSVPIVLFLFTSWVAGLLFGFVSLVGYLHAKRTSRPMPELV